MKKNLKLMLFFAFVALSFSIPRMLYGMEDYSSRGEQSKKVLGNFDITRESQQTGRASELGSDILLTRCPAEIKINILKCAVVDSLDDGTPGRLSVVCTEWQSIVKNHKVDIFKFAICEVFSIDPETCERFLNGRLIYKPNGNNDIGKIELRISDLANPLKGTFDLSQCGDDDKYLSISTGYRKGKKAENVNKVEIWLTPRFLVEREVNGSASHFKGIFPAKWPTTAPVGILWTWGNGGDLDWYDYLTTQNMDELSQNSLYEKWRKSRQSDKSDGGVGMDQARRLRFRVSFVSAT